MGKSSDYQIYVIHHYGESYPCYENDVVSPLQANTVDTEKRSGVKLYDNEGYNITKMFPKSSFAELCGTFGEFTALYWIWKNTFEDYVGLFHYRRSLNLGYELPTPIRNNGTDFSPSHYCIAHGLTLENMAFLLNSDEFKDVKDRKCYEALVMNPEDCAEGRMNFGRNTIFQQFKACHDSGRGIAEKFFKKALAVVELKYPDMVDRFKSHFYSPNEPAYFKCQIVASRNFFDEYAGFIMTVLKGIYNEHNTEVKGISNGKNRLYAFMGERLASLFIAYRLSKNYKIKLLPLCFYGNLSSFKNYYTSLLEHYRKYIGKIPPGYIYFIM